MLSDSNYLPYGKSMIEHKTDMETSYIDGRFMLIHRIMRMHQKREYSKLI